MIPPRLIFGKGVLKILDQLLLPDRIKFISVKDAAGTAKATKEMALRGAPLIGCAAAFGFALEIRRRNPSSAAELLSLAGKTAAVTFDEGKLKLDAIKAAIRAQGYKVW